jgi:hypothetical protein
MHNRSVNAISAGFKSACGLLAPTRFCSSRTMDGSVSRVHPLQDAGPLPLLYLQFLHFQTGHVLVCAILQVAHRAYSHVSAGGLSSRCFLCPLLFTFMLVADCPQLFPFVIVGSCAHALLPQVCCRSLRAGHGCQSRTGVRPD